MRWIFDSGLNLGAVSESEAQMLGLEVQEVQPLSAASSSAKWN